MRYLPSRPINLTHFRQVREGSRELFAKHFADMIHDREKKRAGK
jgi:hypothetical protein